MRRILLPGVAVLVSVMGLMQASAAEKKPPEDVKVEDLVRSMQRIIKGEKGLSLVWFVPNEFWAAALAANKALTPEGREAFVQSLDGSFVLVVERGEIVPGKSFFYDVDTIRDALVVKYKDADGKVHELTELNPPPVEVQSVLASVKPMFKSMLGAMGEGMQMFVFKDTDENGKRIVSPYVEGSLVVELKALPKVSGAKATIDMPVDALFVPRHCDKCNHDCEVSWKFCPFCGAALPK